ncbi:TIGR02206 family membrane protein [Paenibacillaceae bacterium]|nr:TIGR02206 family membrane protein [Paenibacillaceae bacterium]
MTGFFGPNGPEFRMYSSEHLLALLVLVSVLVGIVMFRSVLRRPIWKRAIRFGLAIMLIVLYGALQVWYITADAWLAAEALPLQLCTIMLLLAAAALLTRSYRLYELVYFAGISGALQALLTPVLEIGFPHFWYFYFFVGHGGTVAAAIYLTAVEQFKPTVKSIYRTMLFLNGLLLVVYPVNLLTGGNYMFVSRKPSTVSLLDLLGPWPWYLLALEVIALLLFFILYSPFLLKKRR